MYYVSRITGAAALGALGMAVWFSIVLARADFYFRKATPEMVERATEIAPRNTLYLAMRGLELDYEGADSRGLTEQIAALNPLASAPRIRLGLAAEISGDSASAERWLLDAARVDHQFEPRWTLANFYFRAGNKPDEFWKWMRAALEVSYGDRTPAYELCWRVSSDAAEILRRGIPERHEVVGSYLVYLLEKNRVGMTRDVARRLSRYHDAADLPLLFGVCDELIQMKEAAAVEVWAMTGQGAPAGIFNGDFGRAPLNHGFDWRLMESPGVTHVNGNRIVLSGQQGESCSLLRQMLSVSAGKRYRIQWEARTTGIRNPSGLEWRVADRSGALLPGDDWRAGELTFAAGEKFTDLELVYQRPVGEARAEGTVELRGVRMVEAR